MSRHRALTEVLLDRAFPSKPHLASFDFKTEPPTSPGEIFDLASKAVVAGYKVEKAELEERTGYRLMEASSEGLTQPLDPTAGLSPARHFLNREIEIKDNKDKACCQSQRERVSVISRRASSRQ